MGGLKAVYICVTSGAFPCVDSVSFLGPLATTKEIQRRSTFVGFLPLFLPLCAGMISSEYVATKSEGYKRAKTLSYFSGGFRCFGGRLVWSASRLYDTVFPFGFLG